METGTKEPFLVPLELRCWFQHNRHKQCLAKDLCNSSQLLLQPPHILASFSLGSSTVPLVGGNAPEGPTSSWSPAGTATPNCLAGRQWSSLGLLMGWESDPTQFLARITAAVFNKVLAFSFLLCCVYVIIGRSRLRSRPSNACFHFTWLMNGFQCSTWPVSWASAFSECKRNPVSLLAVPQSKQGHYWKWEKLTSSELG